MEVYGQLHAPAALPRGKTCRTHWIGGWMGPRCGKETDPYPFQKSNPKPLAQSLYRVIPRYLNTEGPFRVYVCLELYFVWSGVSKTKQLKYKVLSF
jgi:hypothetical protein